LCLKWTGPWLSFARLYFIWAYSISSCTIVPVDLNNSSLFFIVKPYKILEVTSARSEPTFNYTSWGTETSEVNPLM
jgi:hypothetical protein